ncbi:MAG: hypothetical protein IJ930_04285 [Lachnospiraceae bacterium]|nr:hypothetical protein [Lachnospiraceae bacterium]
MKIKKRNAFWTFCFSFIPGCAEMYWGFMKAGMSLLIPFWFLVFAAYLTDLPELLFLNVVIYVYAFFHARNMAHMTDEEIASAEDEAVKLFEGIKVPAVLNDRNRAAKWGGILLVIIGCYKILQQICRTLPINSDAAHVLNTFLRVFPRLATALILILLGIRLISGKKEELEL